MSTLYMGADQETVAKYVLFSGDPWRVEVVKQYLENPKKVAFMREFNTYTGTYKGIEVTVTSTGIGAPSAAIAMEEMYEAGMEVAVRMGTVMSMQDDMLGHFLIPIAAMRREGTSQSYVDLSYPAVADIDLVNAMNETVTKMGKRYLNGLNCTMDGFYSNMHDSRFSLEWGRDMSETFEEVKKLGVTGIDMESSCMLTLGSQNMYSHYGNRFGKSERKTDRTGTNRCGRSALQNSLGRNLSLSYDNGGRKK